MNWDNLPREIQEALRGREVTDNQLSKMSPSQVFREYCEWHGLIGWSDTLYDIVLELHQHAMQRHLGKTPPPTRRGTL